MYNLQAAKKNKEHPRSEQQGSPSRRAVVDNNESQRPEEYAERQSQSARQAFDGPSRGAMQRNDDDYGDDGQGGYEYADRQRALQARARPATADDRQVRAPRPGTGAERPGTANDVSMAGSDAGNDGVGPIAKPRKERMSMMPSQLAAMKKRQAEEEEARKKEEEEARIRERQRKLIEKDRAARAPPVSAPQPSVDDSEGDYADGGPSQVPPRAALAKVKGMAAGVAAQVVMSPSRERRALVSRGRPGTGQPSSSPAAYEEEDGDDGMVAGIGMGMGGGGGGGMAPMAGGRMGGIPSSISSAPEVAQFGSTIGGMDIGRITVVVRKRPMSRKEASQAELDVVRATGRRTLQVHEIKRKVDLTRFTEVHEFNIDDVFDESVDTEYIYKKTTKSLVVGVLRGTNASCFAYGQTGSGKTFTMMGDLKEGRLDGGTQKNPGLYVLAARDLFAALKAEEMSLGIGDQSKKGTKRKAVVVSFFEIYGGKLFDLLDKRKELKALVDAQGDVNVVGLSETPVKGVEPLLGLIDQGLKTRSTGSTGANEDSSRSHAVLQITVANAVSLGPGAGVQILIDPRTRKAQAVGKFSVIDLAGSERGADTMHNDRKTRLEGAEINKSLLALKECIRSLYQEADYNPFRGSKLTQVLKDSFVGDSKTVMIATISPNMSNTEHTLNTLRYAYRVKEIRRDLDNGGRSEPPHGSGASGGIREEELYGAVGGAGLSSYLAAQVSNRGGGAGLGGVDSRYSAAAAAADAAAGGGPSAVRVSPIDASADEEEALPGPAARAQGVPSGGYGPAYDDLMRPQAKKRESLAPQSSAAAQQAIRKAAPPSGLVQPRSSVAGPPLPRAVEAKPVRPMPSQGQAPSGGAAFNAPRPAQGVVAAQAGRAAAGRVGASAIPRPGSSRAEYIEEAEGDDAHYAEEQQAVARGGMRGQYAQQQQQRKPAASREAWHTPEGGSGAQRAPIGRSISSEGDLQMQSVADYGPSEQSMGSPGPSERRTRKGGGTPDNMLSPGSRAARAANAAAGRTGLTPASESYEEDSEFRQPELGGSNGPAVVSVDLSSPSRGGRGGGRRGAGMGVPRLSNGMANMDMGAPDEEGMPEDGEEEDDGDFVSAAPPASARSKRTPMTGGMPRPGRSAAAAARRVASMGAMHERDEELFDGVDEEGYDEEEPPPPPGHGGGSMHSSTPANEKAQRMKAASMAVAGQPLNADEQELVSAHRQFLAEMAGLDANERALLDGSGRLGDSASSPGGRGGRTWEGELNRGHMARYATALQDMLLQRQMELSKLRDMLSAYTAQYGVQVGISDPLEAQEGEAGPTSLSQVMMDMGPMGMAGAAAEPVVRSTNLRYQTDFDAQDEEDAEAELEAMGAHMGGPGGSGHVHAMGSPGISYGGMGRR